MKLKVCTKHDCKSNGARQAITNFREISGNTGGYSHVCKVCVCSGRNYTASRGDVEVLGGGLFLINSLKYKLWDNGFVFIHNGFEFVRSANTREWLERTVRLHAQA